MYSSCIRLSTAWCCGIQLRFIEFLEALEIKMWSWRSPLQYFCSTPRADSLPKMQQNWSWVDFHFPLETKNVDLLRSFSKWVAWMKKLQTGARTPKKGWRTYKSMNHLFTSSGSVLELGISELSPFCRNFKSYMSIQHTHHVCHLLSLHPPKKKTAALPMPSVHEWVYTAASLLQKNHSQKHSDVGCRKVSVKMEKFIWRSILEAFPLQSIQKPFHSVLNIFSTNAANPVLSVVGPISTRERHEQSVKHGWDSSTWYSTERSVSQRMPVEAILSRRMCWLCWFMLIS